MCGVLHIVAVIEPSKVHENRRLAYKELVWGDRFSRDVVSNVYFTGVVENASILENF